VGHEQDGAALILVYFQELLLHEVAGLRIKRSERLIHQEDLRVHGIGSRDSHTLAHPARERLRQGVLEVG
jgi:hypothetical protein